MQTKHETVPLTDPRIRGWLPRYQREQLAKVIEADPKGRWVAASWFQLVTTLICCPTRIRNPWTNTVGEKVPDLYVCETYTRKLWDYHEQQEYNGVMFCLAPKISTPEWPAAKLFGAKWQLFKTGWLHWEYGDYQDRLRDVYTWAAETLRDYDALCKPWAHIIGEAVEGEQFGVGKKREAAQIRVARTKEGGISGTTVRLPGDSLLVQAKNGDGRRA